MAVTAKMYANGVKNIVNGAIDLDGDTIKCALVLSSYTPADSHEFWDTSVASAESSGSGYTAGGVALSGKSVASTLADSWATTWETSTAYTVGQVVRPLTGNTHLYMVQTAGTSAGTEPSFPTTRNGQVSDNTVTWQEVGKSIVVWDATDPSWAAASVTARYAVFYGVGTAGSADFLISYINFGSDETSVADTFSITLDATGIARAFVAS